MSYNLNDEANYELEVEALVKILNAFPCYHGYIITRDYQTQIQEDGHTIEVCLSGNGFCKCRWSNKIRLL